MAPLITLLAVTLAIRAAGAARIRILRSWHTSLRGGLAAMFTLTGTAHFNSRREDLIAMVPPALPYPELLITLTGVLELLAAAGLLHRRTAPWAAAGLTLLLVGMFPANVYAAVNGLMINGEPATALLPRTLMQLVYAAATVVVLTPYMRAFRRRRLAETRTALPAGALAGLQE